MRSIKGTDGISAPWERRFLSSLASIVVALLPALARAEPSAADAALAETLFRDGKELMAAKEFDAACPKLQESNRLDPGSGTLLALALCHEGEGRLASAWVEFTNVLAVTADTRPDRALVARAHVAELEPQLSKLTVTVPSALAHTPGLEILRDDVRLDPSAWGAPVPIDGGAHTIEARGAGRKPWRGRFEIAPARDRLVVEVPAWVEGANVTSPAVEPPPLAAGPSRSTPPDVARQRWGAAIGAIGVIGLGVGAYFGVTALSKIHDAKAQCPAAPNCASEAPVTLNAEGSRDATIADVALGVGVVAGAVGLLLVLTGRSHRTAGLRVVPSLDRFGGGLAVERSF
jgi:hypothetical protein